MKLSKAAKSRVKMATAAERKALCKAAKMLAEAEVITYKRAEALIRWCNRGVY